MKAVDTKTSLETMMREVLDRAPVKAKLVTQRYALISTPRSGSKMFVDKLRSTGLMGNPMEWFNLRYMRAYQQVTGTKILKFGPYLKDILSHTSSPNGVFGVNFHIDQYISLKKRGIDIFKYLKFDKVYAIERSNKLAQAFSLSKARVTDVWSSNVAMKPGDQEKIDKIEDSFVLNELRILAAWDEFYEHTLAEKVDATFLYEDVVKDGKGACFLSILNDLGQEPAAEHSFETKLEKQSDSKDKMRIAALEKFILGA